jgi:hypothetical protein
MVILVMFIVYLLANVENIYCQVTSCHSYIYFIKTTHIIKGMIKLGSGIEKQGI